LIFFGHLKNSLPPHLSLVGEIAERLNISNDSACRRIRGEKAISFDELRVLCTYYKVSLDQFLLLQSDAFIFSGKLKAESDTGLEDYLNELLKNFQEINSYNQSMFIT